MCNIKINDISTLSFWIKKVDSCSVNEHEDCKEPILLSIKCFLCCSNVDIVKRLFQLNRVFNLYLESIELVISKMDYM